MLFPSPVLTGNCHGLRLILLFLFAGFPWARKSLFRTAKINKLKIMKKIDTLIAGPM